MIASKGSPPIHDELAVKNERGSASGFLHEHIRIGHILEASAPKESFTLASGSEPVVLLSGGIGMTPLLAMWCAVASDDGVSRDLWWLHSARNSSHHPFKDEVRAIMAPLKIGHLCIVYSRPDDNDRLGIDYDVQGHINVSHLAC